MAHVRTVSTDVVPAGERFAFWRETMVQTWGQFAKSRFTLSDGRSFHGFLESGNLGSLQLCRLKVGSYSVERPQPQPWEKSARNLSVVFQVKGQSYYEEEGGGGISLSPGQCRVGGMRSLSKLVFAPHDVEQLLLVVPDAQLQGLRLQANLAARSFSCQKGLGRLLYELLSATSRELPGLSEQSELGAAATVAQLVNYSLLEFLGDRPTISFREALHSRACAYILQNLRDPALNVGQIAGAMRCSKRYLHLVFAGGESTVEELIWRRRLDGCKSDLQNPALARRSVTDIAFSWGFNNYTHFSRKFKDAFGLPPRDVRAQAAERRQTH